MKIKDEAELISEATQLITDKYFEKAYKVLYMAEVYTDYSINSLFLIAKLSMLLKKSNNIPGHIITLKSKRDDGFFTKQQDADFLNLLKEYQAL